MVNENLTDALCEEFEDMGFTLDDPKMVDVLAGLCDVYGFTAERISCEYMAFHSHKKLPPGQSPNPTTLEDFEKSHLKPLQEQKAKSGQTFYDISTLPSSANTSMEDEAFENYGTPIRNSKRQLTPGSDTTNKRLTNENGLPSTPTRLGSPALTPSAGRKYNARTTSGTVAIKWGDHLSSVWTTEPSTFTANVRPFGSTLAQPYRFMLERLRDKAGILDETICRQADALVAKYQLDEPQNIALMHPDPFIAVGRICCDSEGRLNAKSILFQGSQDLCHGRSLPMDVSRVDAFSLFPGQIVAAECTNPTGNRLLATKIYSDVSPPSVETKQKLSMKGTGPLQVVYACGPFTTADNMSYEPLQDLLKYVKTHRPHVLLLCGPFVDAKHPMIEDLNDTFEATMATVMTTIAEAIQDINTRVVIVPSTRDVHHFPIYPQPPFPPSQSSDRIHMFADPCQIDVEGIVFGLTSTDILFHLGKEEISYPPRGDRLRRLVGHLFQQRSFYPLYPANEELNVDFEQHEAHAQMNAKPHVLILPSDLTHFFKDVEGCLVVNPQRLVKGESGGAFVRMCISPAEEGSFSAAKQIQAELVRI